MESIILIIISFLMVLFVNNDFKYVSKFNRHLPPSKYAIGHLIFMIGFTAVSLCAAYMYIT